MEFDVKKMIKEAGYKSPNNFAVKNKLDAPLVYYWCKQNDKLGYNTKIKIKKLLCLK